MAVNEIGKRLKYLRTSKKKTQKEIALFLEMTPNAYQKYELNTREPSIDVIVKLAKYYDVPYDFIFGGGIFNNWENINRHWEIIIAAILNNLDKIIPELRDILLNDNVKKSRMIIANILNNFIEKIEIDDTSYSINIVFKI